MINDLLFLASWLTHKKCPQQNINRPVNFDQISKWYTSIHETGSRGVIIHDCFNDSFIREYTSDNVQFLKNSSTNNLPYAPNDSRFFMFDSYIKNNLHDHVSKIFVTDMDVSIQQNFTDQIQHDKIYVGCESQYTSIDNCDWCKSGSGYSYAYPEFKFWNKPMLNCGIIGGYKHNVSSVISTMCREMLRIKPCAHELATRGFITAIDMPVFAYSVYTLYDDKNIITGEPVCSNFNKNECSRKDVWIVHK